MSGKNGKAWQNRIIGYGEEAPDQLLANPKNWRVHPLNQQQALSGVLRQVGIVQNIIVNRRNSTVVDGHLRVALAISEKQPSIPVTYVDLSDDEEALILATIDPLSAMAATDKQQLDALLREVGAEDAAVQAMLADLAKDAGLYLDQSKAEDPGPQIDKAEELRVKWGCESGQLWEIPSQSVQGKAHRLLCGDSTRGEDVARLMASSRATLLASDPPYNVGKDYGDGVDDARIEQDYETFTRAWFTAWESISDRQIVTPGCYNLARWCRYFDPYHIAPWTKSNGMTNGKVSRFWCWEPMLFFGAKWGRKRPNDIFDFPIGQQKEVANHPCPKPLKMWCDLLEYYSNEGDIIVEAFNGSGTTLVAAEQTGRICYGCEIEPRYVAVALERLAGMGLEPRLLDATPAAALQEVS